MPELLNPQTSFEAASFVVDVSFIGSEDHSTEDGAEPSYARLVSGIQLHLRETKPVEDLQTLADSEDKADLLSVLVPIANRVLRAIRNCGMCTGAAEITFRPWRAETLLRDWNCETSSDGQQWKPLYESRGALWGALFGTIDSDVNALNLDFWPEIQETIQDDLPPRPEHEFVTNSVGHIHQFNFRLALIEAIVCLEIVLSQFLKQYLLVEKELSQTRIDSILNPQIGLFARVAVLLDLALPKKEFENLDVPKVLKAINWRNGIIHKTGHLPHGISDDESRECIFATLELALFLARKGSDLAATPELRTLAQSIASKHRVPVPNIQLLRSHRVSVSFGGTMYSGLPSEGKMLEVIDDVSEQLSQRDKRFVAKEHLHASFGALLGSARATWSKGRLEIAPTRLGFVKPEP